MSLAKQLEEIRAVRTAWSKAVADGLREGSDLEKLEPWSPVWIEGLMYMFPDLVSSLAFTAKAQTEEEDTFGADMVLREQIIAIMSYLSVWADSLVGDVMDG